MKKSYTYVVNEEGNNEAESESDQVSELTVLKFRPKGSIYGSRRNSEPAKIADAMDYRRQSSIERVENEMTQQFLQVKGQGNSTFTDHVYLDV